MVGNLRSIVFYINEFKKDLNVFYKLTYLILNYIIIKCLPGTVLDSIEATTMITAAFIINV